MELPRYVTGSGDGPEALLVHGLSSDAGSWWQVAEHLVGRGWRVTAVDLRGHGAAPRAGSYRVPDYAADLLSVWPDDIGGTPWDAVVGHSLGGAASAAAVAAEPHWTRRLVLIDPVLTIDGPGLDGVRDGILADLATRDAEGIRRKNPRWHDRDVEEKVRALGLVEPETIIATTSEPGTWQGTAHVEGIAVPTLLVSADPAMGGLLPPVVAGRLAEKNPAVSAVTVEGSGHGIHRDDPTTLLLHLDRFLAG